MLDNVITWVVTILLALLAAWGGLQKGKADRQRKRAENAEAALSRSRVQQSIDQTAGRIKDDLVGRQRENVAKQEEVIQAIDGLEAKEDPHEKAAQQERIVADLNTGFNNRH